MIMGFLGLIFSEVDQTNRPNPLILDPRMIHEMSFPSNMKF